MTLPLPKPLSTAITDAVTATSGKITPAGECLAEIIRTDDRLRLIASLLLLALAFDEPVSEFFDRFCPKDIFDGKHP